MLRSISNQSTILILLLLIFLGGFLRVYNINWGAPFYFHPDERNIASSISQLQIPHNLNPHFFAYGSLPLYTILFIGGLINIGSSCSTLQGICHISFEQAIIIGRILSATFSILLIPLVFGIGRKIGGKAVGLIASFFAALSIGLIQYAHFATFEMWTTFFAVFQLLLVLFYLKHHAKKIFGLLILITGILIAIKISNFVFLAVPFTLLLFTLFEKRDLSKRKILKQSIRVSILGAISLIFLFCFFIITNPYAYLTNTEYTNSLTYESSVAIGTLDVFYTGEFFNSLPVIFQMTKVFPFLLNPILTPIAAIACIYTIVMAVKKRSAILLFLILSFSLLFFSQSFLYVKWIRYMVPTLPFLYLMIAYMTVDLFHLLKQNTLLQKLFVVFIGIVLLTSFIFSYSFFHAVYVEEDTRIAARDFARENIDHNSSILSEVYDMGIVPFNDVFHRITLFNFYDLDSQGEAVRYDLEHELQKTDYLILPSQRIITTRLSHPEKFPVGNNFYKSLTNQKTYEKIYETPCSLFCRIAYLGNPMSGYEGTATVFDRPSLMIFRVNE